MKLQQKFFLSYLFFISFFSVFFISSVYLFFTNQSKKDLLSSAEKTYSQASAMLDYQFKQFLYASYILNHSEEISHALDVPREELANSPGKQNLEATNIRNAIYRSILPLSDAQMRMYVDDAFSYVLDSNILESLSCLEQYSWYQESRFSNKLAIWQVTSQKDLYTSQETPALSLFRKVDAAPSLGWISELYIYQSDLQEILATADPTQNGAVFLQAADGSWLSGTSAELYENFLAASDSFFRKGQMDWESVSVAGQRYWVYSRSLSSTGFYMTLLLPMDSTSISLTGMVKYTVLIFLNILAFSIVMAHFFTRSFSRRLLELERKMAALCAGDLDTRIEEKGKDEITHLFQAFNYMANEMKLLVSEQYENGIRVKTAELNALQAQINPHFLYNTLELINWKAMESDSPEIVQISQNLAGFYRLTLSNGRSMVPLRDELEQISRYLDIQNFRFSPEIRMDVDVPEDCLMLLIPKLTLQPLIENSVLHGFRPKEDLSEGENIIWIKAARREQDLLITVADNGLGMTEEQLAKILTEEKPETGHGFGVINIQQRIRILFGKEYGLSYEANRGQGVSVSIRLKVE